VTNDDFAAYLDTSDEWITQRTGIKRRHKARDDETTVTLSAEASRRAIADAGLQPAQIDLIVVATATPEMPLPSTACLLQDALGIEQIPAFDIAAACSGLLYGMVATSGLMNVCPYENVLVVGAEVLSRMVDPQDRTTCVLFGDAASAVVLSRSPDPERGFLHARIGADGQLWNWLWVPAGGTREPAAVRTVNEKLHYIRMRGKELFKAAVTRMQGLMDEALAATGISPDDLAMIIPHQSNLRIIESFRNRLKLPKEKVAVNIDEYGNTSAASIGLALDEARRNGKLKEGDLVLLVAFGAGVTWGSLLLRL
jgi:3-oxoacyl-[acyl-carrier-protein] synthase-3